MEKNIKVIIGVAFFLIIILLFFMFFSTFKPGNKDEVGEVNVGLIEARVKGTPTFFINGKRIEGFRDFEFFKELIIKS